MRRRLLRTRPGRGDGAGRFSPGASGYEPETFDCGRRKPVAIHRAEWG
jgi:hypothetical protein